MKRFSTSAGKERIAALRKRQKSRSELLDEQLASATAPQDEAAEHESGYGGTVEEYDFAALAEQQQASPSAKASAPLRRRGPLDARLSEGRYAAVPVARVQDTLDDIFGALDMTDMDAEGEEVLSEGEGDAGVGAEGRKRRKRRAKDLSEEEYMAWLEAKQSRKRRRVEAATTTSAPIARKAATGKKTVKEEDEEEASCGDAGEEEEQNDELYDDAAAAYDGGDPEEALILRQLEAVRQQQVRLLQPSASATDGDDATATRARRRERTREAVRHYGLLYAQLLRLRVKLQPAVIKAVCLPQYYALPMFLQGSASSTKGSGGDDDAACDAAVLRERLREVRAELIDILTALYAQADGKQAATPTSHKTPIFADLQAMHTRVRADADACLDYWGGKLVQANSAKLKTIAQPLTQQIQAILAVKSRLKHKVQRNRAHLFILAHPAHELAETSAAAKAQRALHIAEGDIDEEVYDDADFVRELVHRGGNVVTGRLEEQLASLQKDLLPETKASRKQFHRLTKGKTVSYDPMPKLVGFLVAEGYGNSGRNEVVIKSLFQ